jgi:hypothetical protein
MESLVMLAITKSRCIREFSIFIRWVEFHPPPLPLLQPRQPRLDLPLDLEECHGKFGDASYYRAQMHKEQTDRQTFFFIYIDRVFIDVSTLKISAMYTVSSGAEDPH